MAGLSKAREIFHDTIYIRLLYDDTSHTSLYETGLHIIKAGGSVSNG